MPTWTLITAPSPARTKSAHWPTSLLLFALLVTSPAFGSTLFDEDSVLEVTLSGPLARVIKDKHERREHSFTFSADGAAVEVQVRVRGNSRVIACPFPPFRLNFSQADLEGSFMEGEDKLKLVTHCKNGSDKSQDSVLNEFAAYRIFNLISDQSYRVRLLSVQYVDTDREQTGLEGRHYGFLIESGKGLARRLNGIEAEIDAVRYSTLDLRQTARLNVFQYLIGNKDWSFVTARDDNVCCHNIDLLNVDGKLVPIPYDFDLAALTRANYRISQRLPHSLRREYSGYCRSTEQSLAQAVDQVQLRQGAIMALVHEIPALDKRARKRRVAFSARYFDEAENRDKLLAKFKRSCIG